VLLLLGRTERAVAELEAAVKLAPDHPLAPHQLAIVKERLLERFSSPWDTLVLFFFFLISSSSS